MTEEPGKSEEGESVPVLTIDDIKKMKVMELRSALHARAMITKGWKSVVVSRLEEEIEKNVPLMKNCAPEVIEHCSGGKFPAGAYWMNLDPEAEVIDGEGNVDEIRFRGPTFPAVDHEITMFED